MIENKIKECRFVEQKYGSRRKSKICFLRLLCLHFQTLKEYCKDHNITWTNNQRMSAHEELKN